MYANFFELARNPFDISPDPSFLYETGHHREAIAGLYYGVQMRKGCAVLTGEVGTGKTLVLRCLLERLEADGIPYAYVFNTMLTAQDFLRYVAEDLGIVPHGRAKSALLLETNRRLIERHAAGQSTVLIVDEAQNLRTDVLEEIRLLTNLETADGKLLQIVLAGQPEFDRKLDQPELRQLKQRVSLRFRLGALNADQTLEYILWRLQAAGDGNRSIFGGEAARRVFHFSRGIPRLINTLCDNAMLSAYALGQPEVSANLVDEAAADLCLPGGDGAAAPGGKKRRRHRRRGR